VALAYVYNRWKTSLIRCYVNGSLVSTLDMAWLVSPSEVEIHIKSSSPNCMVMITQWVNKCISLPVLSAVLVPLPAGCGRVSSGDISWLITLCQAVLSRRGRRWLILPSMAPRDLWTCRGKTYGQTVAKNIYG